MTSLTEAENKVIEEYRSRVYNAQEAEKIVILLSIITKLSSDCDYNYKNKNGWQEKAEKYSLEIESIRQQLLAQCRMTNHLLDEKAELEAELKRLKEKYESKLLGRP